MQAKNGCAGCEASTEWLFEGVDETLAQLRTVSEDLLAIPPLHVGGKEPGEHFRGGIHSSHPAVEVQGDDAAADGAQDAVGVVLELGQLLEPMVQLSLGGLDLLVNAAGEGFAPKPVAEVDEAELALGYGAGEVTVAVMDSGIGFDEGEVPEDRIGLRTSIRARIEQEGGTVRLWSTKGVGTTIVLTVPEGGE